MHKLDWYLDTARARLKLPSDRQLAPYLGVTDSAITQYRTKRSWPTGKVMTRLAEHAGVDPQLALAELGAWREPEVMTWRKMIDTLTRSAAALSIALLAYFVDFDGGASARTLNEQPAAQSAEFINYATIRGGLSQ